MRVPVLETCCAFGARAAETRARRNVPGCIYDKQEESAALRPTADLSESPHPQRREIVIPGISGDLADIATASSVRSPIPHDFRRIEGAKLMHARGLSHQVRPDSACAFPG
jgi:hypothetical protein